MIETTYDAAALLARYEEGPPALREVLAGLGEGDLDRGPAPEEWTIRQIMHHIVDGDDIWKVCIKAALGNSAGIFSLQWYWDLPQNLWAERWNYAGRALEPSLVLFEANRRHIGQLLREVPEAFERHIIVRWPQERDQEIPVWWVVEMQAQHALGHIEDIRVIRDAHHLGA